MGGDHLPCLLEEWKCKETNFYKTGCVNCMPGFYQYEVVPWEKVPSNPEGVGLFFCEICPIGCRNCLSSSECFDCKEEDGYFLSNNTCIKCDAECSECFSAADRCSKCTDPRKVVSSHGKCIIPGSSFEMNKRNSKVSRKITFQQLAVYAIAVAEFLMAIFRIILKIIDTYQARKVNKIRKLKERESSTLSIEYSVGRTSQSSNLSMVYPITKSNAGSSTQNTQANTITNTDSFQASVYSPAATFMMKTKFKRGKPIITPNNVVFPSRVTSNEVEQLKIIFPKQNHDQKPKLSQVLPK